MAGHPGYHQYKQQAVLTASRGKVLILLYEAAVQNVKKATLCLEKKDLNGKSTHILKTHDILNELTNSLDFDAGGDIARNLERLYNFMVEQLIQANLQNSKEALQMVLKLLETLLSGWRVAVEQAGQPRLDGQDERPGRHHQHEDRRDGAHQPRPLGPLEPNSDGDQR